MLYVDEKDGAKIEGLASLHAHALVPTGPEHGRRFQRHTMRVRECITWQRCLLFLGLAFILITILLYSPLYSLPDDENIANEDLSLAIPTSPDQSKERCAISPKLTPPDDGLEDSKVLFAIDKVLERQVERLSAVVNVSTISYDDNGPVGEDMRWETFGELHAVLKRLFPVM